GWYKEKTFDHKVSMIPRGSTGDRVLYAKWEVNRYKIRFDKNGATSGSMDDMKGCKYGKSYRLYRNEYKRTGYIFTEWNTKADGSGKSYADRQSVKNLTTKDDVTITLYAQWEPIKYTIEFDGNGSSSGKMDSIDCTYGYSYTLPENTFVRKKFKFDCWNTKSDGSGTSYADKAQVANLATIDGDRITLYAQWDEDFTEIPMNVSKPSQNDISWYISSHPYSNSDVYSLAPSFMEPFREGTLSVQSQTNSLNLLNTYRYIAGIHTNVSINDTYSSHAAKGALILRMNGAMSQDPARPTALSDPKYDQLYADGKDGCKRSILADGNPSLSMRSAFDMWMSDSDQNNIRMVGHRRWILYPSLYQVGFGKADTGTGAGGSYCAAYVIPGESTTTSSTRVAWPANNTPTGFFKDGTPWSMSLGRTISSSEVKVKVIRDKDNKVWKFTASSSDGDFYVSNDGCGTPGCIIFRPKDLEVKSDESYTVKIFLYDREEMIKYKVNFFSL
nr:InlB B-repeat-containing protein [Lachnospiraceae bacterium]